MVTEARKKHSGAGTTPRKEEGGGEQGEDGSDDSDDPDSTWKKDAGKVETSLK